MYRQIFLFMIFSTSSIAEPAIKHNFNSEPLAQPAKPGYSMPIEEVKHNSKEEGLISKVKLQLLLLGFWGEDINEETSNLFYDTLNSFCVSNNIQSKKCSLNNEKMLHLLGVQRFAK